MVANITDRTGANYPYAIRRIKWDAEDIVNERFANAVHTNNGRDFWSEVKRVREYKSCPSNVVDKSSTPSEVSYSLLQLRISIYIRA